MEYSRYANGIRVNTRPYSPYEQRSTEAYNIALAQGLAAAGLTMQQLCELEVIITPEVNAAATAGDADGKPVAADIGHIVISDTTQHEPMQNELQAA